MARLLTTVAACCLIVCGKLTYTDGYCFRYRDAVGSRGNCQELVESLPGPDGGPVDTREACCLMGAEGWSDKIRGRRCEEACQGPEEEQDVPGQAGVEQVPQGIQQGAQIGQDQNLVEGVWGRWSDWQPCSVTCGKGFKAKRRECKPSPDHPGDIFQCTGDRVEHQECITRIVCPVHGQWGEWSPWSECSATCGDTMIRYRDCDSPHPQSGGNQCVGENTEVQWCNEKTHCPIHGGWREWLDWSPCSITCGRDGQRRRIRRCTAPKPRYGGQDCDGDQTEIQPCKANRALNCPVDGGVSVWGRWRCPIECANGGLGFAVRTRTCSNPRPQYGGKHCRERLTDFTNCSETVCPVDGMWSSWSSWNECSSTCGKASFKTRTRMCDSPPPTNGGLRCDGETFQKQNCKLKACPRDENPLASDRDSSVVPSSEAGSGRLCDDEDYAAGEGGSGCRESAGSGRDSSEDESSQQEPSISSLDYY